jgi:hypothetical protein
MNKINGYTEEEATGLIEYIYEGKNAGKTLTYLFETYGREHNRAKGSVRNYYYAFLKKRDDLRVKAILAGKELKAGEKSVGDFTAKPQYNGQHGKSAFRKEQGALRAQGDHERFGRGRKTYASHSE